MRVNFDDKNSTDLVVEEVLKQAKAPKDSLEFNKVFRYFGYFGN